MKRVERVMRLRWQGCGGGHLCVNVRMRCIERAHYLYLNGHLLFSVGILLFAYCEERLLTFLGLGFSLIGQFSQGKVILLNFVFFSPLKKKKKIIIRCLVCS